MYGTLVCLAATIAVIGGFVAMNDDTNITFGCWIATVSALFAVSCYFRRHF